MSDFYHQVYETVKLIPKGRVSTYGAIARYLGSPQSARMVGWALNGCRRHDEHIPAHRVVNRTGTLTGKRHFGGQLVMAELLENEGIIIIDDQIQNFDSVLWDPMNELGI